MNEAIKKVNSKKFKNIIATNFFILNMFGVNDEKSLKRYHYLSQFVPTMVKKVCGAYNKEFSNQIIKYAIKELNYTDNAFEIVVSAFNKLKLIKTAYPNDNGEILPIKKYDLNKWINALNDIYIRTRLSGNKREAINQVISQWDNMDEKIDFERWARFYEQGGMRLYKSAQPYSPLPIQAIPGLIPKNDSNFVSIEEAINPDKSKKGKDLSLDELRSKIVNRISSIEKLFLNNSNKIPDVQYDRLLNTLITLKKEIFGIRTAAMLENIINRELLILKKSGCDDGTIKLFTKIAQLPPLPTDPAAAAQPAAPAPAAGNPEEGKAAITNFVSNLGKIDPRANDIKVDLTEKPKPEDIGAKPAQPAPAASAAQPTTSATSTPATGAPKTAGSYNWAIIDTPQLNKFEKVANNLNQLVKQAKEHLYITAQEAPTPTPTPTPTPAGAGAPVPVATPAPEGTEEIGETEGKPTPKKRLEDEPLIPVKSPPDTQLLNIQQDVLERALANIKLSDVITRMQALSRVFKNREIARQLSIIDIMLDKLGISGFFPSLAEATRSALESNQYCQTRVEEVLSKLISATDAKGASLIGSGVASNSGNSIVDNEMDEYLKEKPKEEKTPATEVAPIVPQTV